MEVGKYKAAGLIHGKQGELKYILTEGDVDFSNSDTKSVPCKTYIVESELKEREWKFTVKNCRDKATLQQIEMQ